MTHTPTISEHEKELLLRELSHSVDPREMITRRNLLSCTRDSLTLVVDYNRHHELVHTATNNSPDFFPRAFTILVFLYNAYSIPNPRISLLSDVIGLLDSDLKKTEEETLEYHRSIQHPPFFPGLHRLWVSVNNLYGECDCSTLPSTPHLAFFLLTMNHPEIIGKPIEFAELHEKLIELHK